MPCAIKVAGEMTVLGIRQKHRVVFGGMLSFIAVVSLLTIVWITHSQKSVGHFLI